MLVCVDAHHVGRTYLRTAVESRQGEEVSATKANSLCWRPLVAETMLSEIS